MKETVVLEVDDAEVAAELATPGLWKDRHGNILVRTHMGLWISDEGTHGMEPDFVRRCTVLR